MPRNVEIKAHVRNVEDLHTRAKALSKSEGEVLHQEDTFYNSPQGRLKLRVIKVSSYVLAVWLVNNILVRLS